VKFAKKANANKKEGLEAKKRRLLVFGEIKYKIYKKKG
jgi:hypothetical protein